jgi:hypothetical protein
MLDSQTTFDRPPHQNPSHSLRVALLIPSAELGAYWQPIVKELAKISQQVIIAVAI